MTQLHPLSFPHVFDAIIDSAAPESLPTLRQVCHFFRHRVDERLARSLSYARPAAVSKRGVLRSSVCSSVWRPCWQHSPDVHLMDFAFERKGHFLDSRLWHESKAAPGHPNLRYARFLHAPACMTPDPEEDEDMRMQPLPTVIVPRVAGCDYNKRRGGMDTVFVHKGTKRVIFPTAAKPTDSVWEAKLQATPRQSVDVTILLLERHEVDAPTAETKEDKTKLPMLETIVRQLMEEYYAGHLASASLVGVEGWRAAIPALSEKEWNALIALRIRETAERSEYADFDIAGFLDALKVASTKEWRETVGEEEYELAAGAYDSHRAWLEETGWDPKAVKVAPTPETRPNRP